MQHAGPDSVDMHAEGTIQCKEWPPDAECECCTFVSLKCLYIRKYCIFL